MYEKIQESYLNGYEDCERADVDEEPIVDHGAHDAVELFIYSAMLSDTTSLGISILPSLL